MAPIQRTVMPDGQVKLRFGPDLEGLRRHARRVIAAAGDIDEACQVLELLNELGLEAQSHCADPRPFPHPGPWEDWEEEGEE